MPFNFDVDPDPGYFFKIYLIVLIKKNLQIFFLFFLLIFMLNLDEPFKKNVMFIQIQKVAMTRIKKSI